jgi:hypothetical protein
MAAANPKELLMKRALVPIAALVAVAALAIPAVAAAPVNVPAKFSKLLPKVRSKGQVPVRLPSSLDAGVKPSRVYGAIEELKLGRYHLSLGGGKGCHESTACFVAAFLGTRGGSVSGSRKVTLTGGIKGRFTPISCGASCAAADVQWKQGGVAYSVQFKGTKGELVALANSAIAAGPR